MGVSEAVVEASRYFGGFGVPVPYLYLWIWYLRNADNILTWQGMSKNEWVVFASVSHHEKVPEFQSGDTGIFFPQQK